MMKSYLYNKAGLVQWVLFFIGIAQCISVAAQPPNINRIEYYLDADPGYGNATSLSFSGTNDVSTAINLNLVPLNSGVHILGVRSRDANGSWSLDNKWLFLKPHPVAGTVVQPNINRVEWYLDADPGYGNGTDISIVPRQDLSNLAVNIGLAPLFTGVHIFGVRSLDANGVWSLDNKWLFVKPYPGTGAVVQPNINRVEWFLDTDPGYGNATPISITPGQDLGGLSINIGLAPLFQGVHIVGIRSLDANGVWSMDNKWIFLKPYTSSSALPQPQVVGLEYFIDTDPGYGNGTPVTIVAAADVASVIFNADISVVPNGAHKLGIRSLDANGSWCIDNKVAFTGGTLVSNTFTWVGNSSTDWMDPANWSSAIVPSVTKDVVIPSGRPFFPVIANTVIGHCKTIQVNPGAIITIATGGNLKVGL